MNTALPAGACDAHFHIFEPVEKYPTGHASPMYQPFTAPMDDLLAMHAAVGIQRGVYIHPHVYGNDFRLLEDLLKRAPGYRAIILANDTLDDAQLARLHALGVRGSRFLFQSRFGSKLDFAEFHRTVARIGELGWVAKLFFNGDDLPELEPEFRKIKQTVLIDHMGRFDFAKGTAQPAVQLLLRLLKEQRWWMQLSNGDVRDDGPEHPWEEAIPFGQAYYAAAPDRCIWGTDWPHVAYNRRNIPWPSDAGLADLLRKYVPDDAAFRKVLVDNADRLYGFSTG